jgi:hypothetical protein
MSKDDPVDEKLEEEDAKTASPASVETVIETPKKKRKGVRRRKKDKPKKDDGELEPFDLKSFFIPKDRNWVLPVFVAIVVLLFGYYMVVFMGVVSDTCDDQAEIGDADCDGYVDDPDTSSDDLTGDGSDSNDNSTSGDTSGNGTGGS